MLSGRHSRHYCSISSARLADRFSFDNRSSGGIDQRNIDAVLHLSLWCDANQPAVLIHASIVPLALSETLENHFVDLAALQVIWVDLAGARVSDLNHLPVIITVLWHGLIFSRVVCPHIGILSCTSGGLLPFVLKSFLLDCVNWCSSLLKGWTCHLEELGLFFLSLEEVPLHLLLEFILSELSCFLMCGLHFLQL